MFADDCHGPRLALLADVGEERDCLERDEICDELLEYLRTHPDAMDTLTGIADWWLPQGMHVGIERVAQALRTLERRELIERIGSEDRPMFRLRRATRV